MSFASILRQHRLAAEFTQGSLAAQFGAHASLPQGRISAFERGVATPDHHQGRLLGEALGLKTDAEWLEWHEALAASDAELRGRTEAA